MVMRVGSPHAGTWIPVNAVQKQRRELPFEAFGGVAQVVAALFRTVLCTLRLGPCPANPQDRDRALIQFASSNPDPGLSKVSFTASVYAYDDDGGFSFNVGAESRTNP